MKSLLTIALGIGLTAAGANAAVVKNISTGIDNATGLQLADGASDTDYAVAAGSAGFVGAIPIARSVALPPTYVSDATSTASRWIGINSGVGIQSMTVPGGNYTLATTVDLTGYDPATALLSNSRFSADDVLISLRINGSEIFSQPPRDTDGDLIAFHNLNPALGAGLFHAGSNTISFQMYNLNGPMTLRFEGAVTATPIPEPAALPLLAFGAAGLCARRKRAPQKKNLC